MKKKKKKNKTIKSLKNFFIQMFIFFGMILFFYGLLCLYIYSIQESLIFVPSKNIYEIERKQKIFKTQLKTDDNKKLEALFLKNNSDKVVLFFHGNGGNIYSNQHYLRFFDDLGLNAFIFDYRSYGNSEGEIDREIDLYRDGTAAYEYLKEKKGFLDKNIIFWGHSLGNAISLNLAQNKKLKAVIVESAFSSLEEISRQKFSYLPINYILKYKFYNYEKIQSVKSPILIIHSKKDEVLDFENGEKLFKLANFPKSFLVTQSSHNNGLKDNYYKYRSNIKNFLEIN